MPGKDPGELARAAQLEAAREAIDENWDAVLADMAATAEEYDELDWTAITIEPADVEVFAADETKQQRPVFAVHVDEDDYEQFGSLVEGGASFDRAEVFKAAENGAVFVVVALEDETRELAVTYPLYYVQAAWGPLYGQGDGAVAYTRVTGPDGDYFEVTHDDPELFAPPAGGETQEQTPETQPEPGEDAPGAEPQRVTPSEVEPDFDLEEDLPEYDELSDLPPEELARIPRANLRQIPTPAFRDFDEDQLAALDVPTSMRPDESEE